MRPGWRDLAKRRGRKPAVPWSSARLDIEQVEV